jgi:hypothetical protein
MELKDAIKGIKVVVASIIKDKDGKEIRKVIERDAMPEDILSFNEKTKTVVTVDGKKYKVK